MQLRHALFVTAGVVGAAVGGAAISSAITDPEIDVDGVEMTTLDGPPPAAAPAASSGSAADPIGPSRENVVVQTVEGLEQLTGTLRAGQDADDWFVSGIEVDFGPDGWISGAPALGDYDGDGTDEELLAELRGLDGRNVTLGVRYEIDDDRDDAAAFIVEGRAFRDPAGGPAPWQVVATAEEATRDEVAAAAAAAVGQGAVAVDIDREVEDGWAGWDIEVRAADGRYYQAYVDLAGDVIDVRPETD
jgi:hypothetical protein